MNKSNTVWGESAVCYFCFVVFCFFAGQWFKQSWQPPRMGIFNEVCPHFVLPATGPQASTSLPCFALRLLGRHRALPESASSEAVPLPLQHTGEAKRRLGTDVGSCATARELGS